MFFIACGDFSWNVLNFNKLAQFSSLISRCSLLLVAIPLGTVSNFNKLSQFSSLISRCSLLLVAIPLGTFLISINWLNFILSSLDVLYCLWRFLLERS